MGQHTMEAYSHAHSGNGIHTEEQGDIQPMNSALPEQGDGESSCKQGYNHNDKDYSLVQYLKVQ
jgi:hypothetical protein